MAAAMQVLHRASFGISFLGVLVIVLGVFIGLARFLRSEIAAMRGLNVELFRHSLRRSLGYYLLLGLEFLIAADIIDTLMKPDTREIILLGAIVAIRTVISFSLKTELSGETASKASAT